MDNFVIGNMVWNGGVVVFAGFLVKRYMDGLDKKIDEIKTKFDDAADYTQSYRSTMANDLKSIAVEMKVANGRTGKIEASIGTEIAKLEGKLDVQIAKCQERNGIHDR